MGNSFWPTLYIRNMGECALGFAQSRQLLLLLLCMSNDIEGEDDNATTCTKSHLKKRTSPS